jgi:hypothetical protein
MLILFAILIAIYVGVACVMYVAMQGVPKINRIVAGLLWPGMILFGIGVILKDLLFDDDDE